MEFEDLQKIWDTQNNQTLYAINETAMYNHIMLKQKQSRNITHISELLVMITNAGTAILIAVTAASSTKTSIALYTLAVWLMGCAVYTLTGRLRRIRGSQRFDRSLQGELAYALSVAIYQVRLSRLMRWNMLPMAVLLSIGLWETGKPAWAAAAVTVALLLGYFASGWEHRYYERRKRSLQNLQNSLLRETSTI